MNSKHLAKGSQCPPFGKDDEELRIYSMRFCPYAQRALLVAHAKQIKFNVVNCDLTDKADWLLVKNPNGKVPILETKAGGKILYESLIVADYLDEVCPGQRPLTRADPFLRAWDKVLIEEFNKVASLFYSILSLARKEEEGPIKEALGKLKAALDPFEKELKARGTPFFGGRDAPGMLDYMIWPWFERLPVIKLFTPCQSLDFEAMKKEAPLLESWRQAMKADSAVQQSYLGPEVHKKFIQNYFGGTPAYDDII